MTREEFESILEEAFMAGYDNAYEEIFNESEDYEDSEEIDAYDESEEDYDDYDYYNEARDDTKLDRFRKALVRGLDAPAKELGVSDKTRKAIGKTVLAGTGRMSPTLKAKAFAKHMGKAITSATKDSGRIAANAGKMATSLGVRTFPAVDKIRKEFDKNNISKKGSIMEKIFKNKFDRVGKSINKTFGKDDSDYKPGTRFNSEEEANKAHHKLNKHWKKTGQSRYIADDNGKPI